MPFFQWLPESARFDAASGESERALATLQKIADENGMYFLYYNFSSIIELNLFIQIRFRNRKLLFLLFF